MATGKLKSLRHALTRPMTSDESMRYINCTMSSELDAELDAEFALEAGPLAQLMQKRLASFSKAKITRGVALFTMSLTNGNPARAVMWCYTLHRMYSDRPITMTDIGMTFPMGFPTDEAYEQLWDMQKAGGSNMVDTLANWELPASEISGGYECA